MRLILLTLVLSGCGGTVVAPDYTVPEATYNYTTKFGTEVFSLEGGRAPLQETFESMQLRLWQEVRGKKAEPFYAPVKVYYLPSVNSMEPWCGFEAGGCYQQGVRIFVPSGYGCNWITPHELLHHLMARSLDISNADGNHQLIPMWWGLHSPVFEVTASHDCHVDLNVASQMLSHSCVVE